MKAVCVYSRPVIPLLIFLMFGIVFGWWFPGHVKWAYIIILLNAGWILQKIIRQETAFISPLILFFCLGYLSIQTWATPEFPPDHLIHFTDSERWQIVGTIDDTPINDVTSAYRKKARFILKAERLANKNKSFPVTGKVRVTVYGQRAEFSIGDRVTFASRIKPIRNFNNPGGFDYERYMAFKGIWVAGYVRGNKIVRLETKSKKRTGRIIEDVRHHIVALIEDSGPGAQTNLLKALIVGQRSSISPALRESFNRAGIGHILAISGLHIGIVASVAFFIFRWLLSRFSFVLWRGWSKKGAALLSLVPVFVYAILAGMAPSTQRAVIMVTVFLMTFLFEREHDLLNTVAVAAMLILVVYPPSLFTASFQLSFSAVLGILFGMSKMQKTVSPEKRPGYGLGDIFFKLFFVSFFAFLGTLPLAMLYFNRFSLVGLAANLFIIPLIGYIVVPLGLFSVFLYPFSIYGASLGMNICAGVLAKILYIVRFFSDLPFAAVKTFTPTLLEICCYYFLFWAILNFKRSKEDHNACHLSNTGEKSLEKNSSVPKSVKVVFVVVLLVMCADVCYWMSERFWHDDLRVTAIDVGQGTSAFLEFPGGYCLLIDGGGFPGDSTFDTGARIIAPFLWRKKIKTVDTLVLSHPDSDHLKGLLYIAEHFNVKNVWTNNETARSVNFQKFMKIIEKNNIHMPLFKDLPHVHVINGVELKILYPPGNFIDKKQTETWRNFNNNSLVVRVRFGSKSFLFPGDIQEDAEGEIVSMAVSDLKSTVLWAPHHGSKSSSTELFLDKVNPEIVIIPSGWKNRFGFPHPSVLKRYKQRGYRIYRTDHNGAVAISTDGQFLRIHSEISPDINPPPRIAG
ncbi:MAG: DNA internalization-related competence protein ComEC/Rec2 [Deltaproteobacteria bacterium]|nr:DNA internalization-related competence protein ComEC/Rec2 [Deltaproteobacteria bacterium]